MLIQILPKNPTFFYDKNFFLQNLYILFSSGAIHKWCDLFFEICYPSIPLPHFNVSQCQREPEFVVVSNKLIHFFSLLSAVKSRYAEDVYPNNHQSVWGSYWAEGKWGYKCCHAFLKNSYCTGKISFGLLCWNFTYGFVFTKKRNTTQIRIFKSTFGKTQSDNGLPTVFL